MKNYKIKKYISIIAVALIAVIAAALFVGCNDGAHPTPDDPPAVEYTVTFVDGDNIISSVKGKAGDTLTVPTPPVKNGYEFAGWYTTQSFDGDAATVPNTIPQNDITYYAKYELKQTPDDPSDDDVVRIIYEYNLGAVSHSGSVTPTVASAGDEATLKNGSDYGAIGYRFMGWSKSMSYVYDEYDPLLAAGDIITLGDEDITLYAQWAAAYTDAREKSSDIIYVFEPLIDRGLGAAVYVSDGKEDKLGFVASSEQTDSGYTEFVFYYDGGDVTGRLYDDKTYAVEGDEAGIYLNYDYVSGKLMGAYLALDGYGFATYSEQLGSGVIARLSGVYDYDAEYDDYRFDYTDTDGDFGYTYFALAEISDDMSEQLPENMQFDGIFVLQGYESYSYWLYYNGELYYNMLELNGYGSARIYAYDTTTEEVSLISTGSYFGTDNYEDYTGEWQYDEAWGSYGSFSFVLSTVNTGNESLAIYIEYDPTLECTFNAVSGDGVLYTDGYGYARYTVSGMTYIGEFVVSESKNLITFGAYIVDNDGAYTAAGTMYFNVDFSAGTFTMNTEGFIIDGDTLTGYAGTAQIVEIPDGVTAINADAFNSTQTDVSLISVTVPSSVTAIGARAFQNNYTLRRVIFLSATPVALDFASANDPFRWPAGSFIIVVPEGAQNEYIAAWQSAWNSAGRDGSFPYAVKGSEEVTRLPEFEIEDGVLVRYNKQEGSADVLDITIPDGVTEIADNVFRGAAYLRSVDLNAVTKIGDYAFYGCENLVTVRFNTVTAIGEGAFMDCYLLSDSGDDDGVIVLPSIVRIESGAFAGCESLRRVELGENIEYIGDSVFMECNIYVDDPPLFLVVTGDNIPQMGERISASNIAFRIEVKDITVALKCFNAPDWNSYCRHLYIPSGAEKGSYISGGSLLELDGRAMYQSSELWLYAIDGSTITFYAHDSETATYTSFAGTIENGNITVKLYGEGADMIFRNANNRVTYTTADGTYSLECFPFDLDPENYGSSGYADVLFNGQQLKLFVQGYNTKTVIGYIADDGLMYNANISFDGDVLVVTLKREQLIANIQADDGSVMNIHYSGSLIYVYGDFKIKVGTNEDGTDRYLSFSEYTAPLASVEENTYTFTFKFLNDSYTITATVSADGKTFVYSYTVS